MHPFMPYVVGLPAAGAAYGAGLLSMGNGMAKTANTSYAQQQANAHQAAAAQSQREMEAAAANQRRAAVPARQQIGFDAPEADPALRGSSQAESPDAWGQRGPDQAHLYAQPKHQWLEQQPQVDWQNDAAAAQLAAAAAANGQPIMAEWELAFMEQQLRQPNSGLAPQGHQSTDPYSQHSGSSISSAAAVQQSRPQSRAALYGDFRRAQRYGKVDAATMHAAAVQSRRYQLQQQQLQAQQAAAEARLHAPAGSAASSSSSSSTRERGLPPRSSSFTRPGAHHAPRPPKGAPPAANQQSTLSSIRQQQLQPQQPEPIMVEGASRLAHTLAHQRAAKAHAAAQASAAAAAGAAAAAAAQWQARQPQQPPSSQQQQQQQGGFVGASAPNVLYGDTRRFYLHRAKQHIQQHGQDQPQVFLQALTAAQRTELPCMPQHQQAWLNNGPDSAHSTATSAWAYSSYKAAAAQLPRPPVTPADLPSALQTPAVPSVLLCTENMTDEGALEDNEADAFCYIGGQGASAKGSSSKGKGQLDVYNMEMLRIAEVSLCVDALSPVALVKANTLLSASQLPGEKSSLLVLLG